MTQWVASEEITAAKLNDRRGFKSRFRGHRTITPLTLKASEGIDRPVNLDTEDFDSNSEFDCPAQRTGTATATTASHLIDTTKNQFVPADVGRYVYNSTDKTYSLITAYNSSSDLTIQTNIMANGEGYRIYGTKYTAKIAGYYQVIFQCEFNFTADQDIVFAKIKKNTTTVLQKSEYASGIYSPIILFSDLIYLDVNDYLEFFMANFTASDKTVVDAYASVYMVSEP